MCPEINFGEKIGAKMENVNQKPSSSSFDKAECQETTESSSSFDDTDSEVENADTTLDYSEALSDFHGEIGCIGFGDVFSIKKRKLTNHWRSFIQPLMWRCKWTELQILKLDSQAQKYDRKLKKYVRQKQIQLENSTLEDLGVKSVPISCNNARRRNILRRKKRRKIETTTDLSEYMSNHNLFSFYENRKGVTKGVLKVNEFNNPEKVTQKVKFEDEFWDSDEPSCLELVDDSSSEPILRKIDSLQSQVGNLKSRVGKILSENAEIISCIDNLNLPMSCDDFIGSPENSDSPPKNRGTTTIGARLASQLLSEYFANAFENGEDDVLIDDQRVKEKMNNLEDLNIFPIQRTLARTALVPEEPDLPTKLASPNSTVNKGRGTSRGRLRFTS
ncbi:hypothetical protein ACJIZ3_007803 [Penstemon smallii]|uniref:Uncharacterized protein n=1 Tax=Penstemon smallii TaxID=265156 RepID=A0ABD3T8B2_9LAMI